MGVKSRSVSLYNILVEGLLPRFIPLCGNFGLSTQWRTLDLFKVCGVSRDQGDASFHNSSKSRIEMLE